MYGKLDVRTSRCHTDFSYDRYGCIPEVLILPVRQCLRGGHCNGISRVHSHGIEILYGTDDHHIVT